MEAAAKVTERRARNAKAARRLRLKRKEEELLVKETHQRLLSELPLLKRKIEELREELASIAANKISESQAAFQRIELQKENEYLREEVQKHKRLKNTCLKFIDQMTSVDESAEEEALFNKNYYFILQNVLAVIENKNLLESTPLTVDVETLLLLKIGNLQKRLEKQYRNKSVFLDFIESRNRNSKTFDRIEVRSNLHVLGLSENHARVDIIDIEVPVDALRALLTEIHSNTDWVFHLFYALVDMEEAANFSPSESLQVKDLSKPKNLNKLKEGSDAELFGLMVQAADVKVSRDCFPDAQVGQVDTYLFGESFMPGRMSSLESLADSGLKTLNGKVIRKGSAEGKSSLTMSISTKNIGDLSSMKGLEIYKDLEKLQKSAVYSYLNEIKTVNQLMAIQVITLDLIKYLYEAGKGTLQPQLSFSK